MRRLQVGGIKHLISRPLLHIRPVVQKVVDGNACCKLRNAAHVIGMEVRDKQIIDAMDARQLCRPHNALRVAGVKIRPSGVHQQRLARRRDDQRGLPALDIDEIDFETCRLCILLLRGGNRTGGVRRPQARPGGQHKEDQEGEDGFQTHHGTLQAAARVSSARRSGAVHVKSGHAV